MGYDRCAETLVNEKEEILTRAVKEKWNILYTHDPDIALSRVTTDTKGRYVACELEKDFTRKII